MTEYNEILQKVLEQYGLIGLVLAVVIMGPLFTLMRTKTVQAETESKAQEMVGEFARQERQRADRLQDQLNNTVAQLDKATDEVLQLRYEITSYQQRLEEVPKLQEQIQLLINRVAELEAVIEVEREKNHALETRLEKKEAASNRREQRIQQLEQRMGATPQREEMDPI